MTMRAIMQTSGHKEAYGGNGSSKQWRHFAPCSLGLSATSQQYFSLTANQSPATSQQYSSLRTNQRQPSATSQPNRLAEASFSSVLGDVIWPGRLVFSRHVKVDVLLKTATKTYFPLPVRRSASSFALRPPAAMKTERSLQGLVCNFLFFQRGPCKIWAVTTNIFI
jgi:hypothetical protein